MILIELEATVTCMEELNQVLGNQSGPGGISGPKVVYRRPERYM